MTLHFTSDVLCMFMHELFGFSKTCWPPSLSLTIIMAGTTMHRPYPRQVSGLMQELSMGVDWGIV